MRGKKAKQIKRLAAAISATSGENPHKVYKQMKKTYKESKGQK